MSASGRGRQVAAVVALACMVIAAGVAGMALEGYSQQVHPLAWLGAAQLGRSGLAFGMFAFVVPGLVAAWIALALRAALPRYVGWMAPIATQLLLLAALAFAAQGLLRLDLDDMDGKAGRLHATAWLLWALAFPLGACALAAALRAPRGLVIASLAAAALVVAGGFLASGWIGAALAQRLAFAAWLGWNVLAAGVPARLSRGAA